MAEQNARGAGSRAGSTVLDVIRENPVPIALVGVGVGWLVASNSSRGRSAAGYVSGHAQGQAERAKRSFETAIADNPLVVGAVALAAGAIVAALIPQTDAEDRLMGEARDSFVESAQGAAQQALQQVRERSEQLAGEAERAASEAAKNLDQMH